MFTDVALNCSGWPVPSSGTPVTSSMRWWSPNGTVRSGATSTDSCSAPWPDGMDAAWGAVAVQPLKTWAISVAG